MPKARAIGAATAIAIGAWAPAAAPQVAPPAPDKIAVGDWQIAPVVEARAEGEYRHDLDGQDRGLVVERARLGVDVERGPVEARVVLQDARVFDLSGTDFVAGPPAVAVTGAYEAWAEAHTEAGRPSFLRVGRQPIVWGEGRLLGTADASPTGRSLDAVRARLVLGDASIEALAAILEDPAGEFTVTPYGELFGARVEWSFDPLFAVEAYGLARIAQSDPTLEAPANDMSIPVVEQDARGQTVVGAARLHGERQSWAWGVEGVIEGGHVEGASRPGQMDFTGGRLAWAAAGHVEHTFVDALLQPSVRLGGAYASGDGRGSIDRGFDPLLPDVREWHGGMDLFAWSNEAEASVRAAIVPWTDALATIEYRYARLANPSGAWQSAYLLTIGQVAGNTHADLGHEIDARLAWSPWAAVRIEAGYSLLVLGDGAKALLASTFPFVPSLSHAAFADARLRF